MIGDIHGELDGLKKILIHSRLVNEKDDWIGEKSILIQTGDVIDRGPHSWGCVRLLRKLQDQAVEADGKVVRLCGNHETMLMQDPYNLHVDYEKSYQLASEIQEEINLGKVQASYTDGFRFYTHAGLRSEVRKALEEEIGIQQCGLKRLSDHINRVFRNAVKERDFRKHPIFYVDKVRIGSNKVGVIFWGDYSLICSSLNAYDIPQIFGHTPTRKKGVKHSHNFKLIDIDAGMYIGYGGKIVYLEIDKQGNILQHHEDGKKWIETALGPEQEKDLLPKKIMKFWLKE